jgi:hypothetical protein
MSINNLKGKKKSRATLLEIFLYRFSKNINKNTFSLYWEEVITRGFIY